MSGRVLLLLIFADGTSTHSLVTRSPISIFSQGSLLFIVPWFLQVATFDDRHEILRFPLKILFPDLPSQFRVAIFFQELGFVFGISFRNSIDVESVIPSLAVAATPSQEFTDGLFFE